MRAEMEEEYKNAALNADTGDAELRELQKEYKEKVAHVRVEFEQNQDRALQFLVQRSLEVKLEVPAVVIGKFD